MSYAIWTVTGGKGPPNALCTSDLGNKDPNMAREIPNSTIHVNIICTLFPPSTYQQDPFKIILLSVFSFSCSGRSVVHEKIGKSRTSSCVGGKN